MVSLSPRSVSGVKRRAAEGWEGGERRRRKGGGDVSWCSTFDSLLRDWAYRISLPPS